MEKQNGRRESFVNIKRKSLTLNNIFNDDIEKEDAGNPKHSMKSYLESLNKEKDDWKEIFKQKKKLWQDSEEKCKSEPLIIIKKDVEKYISADDKIFLENKPDYLEMVKTVQTYIYAVNYLNKYKLDLIDYYGKACDEIGINNKLVIDKLLALDLCDICNKKNCTVSEHKFKFLE